MKKYTDCSDCECYTDESCAFCGGCGCNHCCLGPQGPAGPAGDTSSACCSCSEQLRNIIQQIITLYPDNDLFVTLNSGDAVVGRPGSLITGPNGHTGVFVVINPQNFEQYLSTCSIDTIQINNAMYNDAIVYLPEPVPVPADCCADCEATIRSLLPVGTSDVVITTSTQTPSTGTVIINEYGMIVLANEAENNITFISSCSIELFFSQSMKRTDIYVCPPDCKKGVVK